MYIRNLCRFPNVSSPSVIGYWRLLAQHVLVGDVISDGNTSLDLVRNRLGHYRYAVDDWTNGCTQRTAYIETCSQLSLVKGVNHARQNSSPLPFQGSSV